MTGGSGAARETPVPVTVLVVEDDPPFAGFLRASLSAAGYHVHLEVTGRGGLRQAAVLPAELILLDLGLPDLDGLEVIAEVRKFSAIPIVVLTARGNERDKVLALDGGADDYLTKPFSVPELMARIRVALRHRAQVRGLAVPGSRLVVGELDMDFSARRVRLAGEDVSLTPIEFRLLQALALHPGRVLTHKVLLHEVWGPHRTEEKHYLHVFVAALRRKLERDPVKPRYILTEPGVGYRFADL